MNKNTVGQTGLFKQQGFRRSPLSAALSVALIAGAAMSATVSAAECPQGTTAGANQVSDWSGFSSDFSYIGTNTYPGDGTRSVIAGTYDAGNPAFNQGPYADGENWQYSNGKTNGQSASALVFGTTLADILNVATTENDVLVSLHVSNVIRQPILTDYPDAFPPNVEFTLGSDTSQATLGFEAAGVADEWVSRTALIANADLSAGFAIELRDLIQPNEPDSLVGDDLAVALQVQECVPDAVPTGSITGSVQIDGVGQAGVTVYLSSDSSVTAVTDADGNFTIEGQPVGDYTVVADMSAFDVTGDLEQATAITATTGGTADFSFTSNVAQFAMLPVTGLIDNGANGTYNFGAPEINTDNSATFTVQNTGTTGLDITSITPPVNSEYAVANDTCTSTTVAVQGTCSFDVTYMPTVEISTPLTDSVVVNYTGGTYNLGLTALAVDTSAPGYVVGEGQTGASGLNYELDFGSVELNSQPLVKSVTVENTGNADLMLLSATDDAPFSHVATGSAISDLCQLNTPIKPGEICNLAYTMETSQIGVFSGQSVVTTNATPATFTVDLKGVVGDKDSDGDGLYDAEEAELGTNPNNPDSDGDGLNDFQEAKLLPTNPLVADTDGDGENDGAEVGADINNPLDKDADTIIDAMEPSNVDTDRDGNPNENDADDDADGIATSAEATNSLGDLLDTDGDTVPDYLESNILNTDGSGGNNHNDANDDNEGGVTSAEVGGDYFRPVDSDGDGIPDYLDASNANNSGDSDGDGLLDSEECPNGFPDCEFTTVTRADGSTYQFPYYMTTESEVVPEAVEETEAETVETGLEGGVGGGGAAGGAMLSLLGLGFAVRRRKFGNISAAAAVAVAATTMLSVAPQAAQAEQGQWYGGIGGGITKVKPETNTTSTGWRIDDSISQGFKAILGYDLTDNWSVEGFLADLGEAKLKNTANNTGTIGYRMGGVSAVYNHELVKDSGLKGLLKLGVAGLDNDSDGVTYKRVEDTQLFAGIGLEKYFNRGVSLRAEFEYFDRDIRFGSLNLIKRFGDYSDPVAPEPVVVAPLDSDGDTVIDDRDECPQTPPGTEVDVRGCTFVADEVVDSDGDGITDARDQCMGTPAGTRVDDTGCPVVQRLTGVLEGVNFDTDSANLTGEARLILDHLAVKLNQYDDVELLLVGHTDNQASDTYNKRLSFDRAKAVASYLVSRGVSAKRMRYIGMGESQPRASNNTPEGRARNRRVELIAK